MTLEKLQSEMIQAMKNKDKVRKNVISGMIDAVKKTAIDKRCRDNISETLVDEVLLKYKKMTQEMVDTCPKDRVETLEEYKAQMVIVDEFAPRSLTDETEIRAIVSDLTAQAGLSLIKANKGMIMKTISGSMRGRADMSIVSRVVSEMLI